MKPSIELYRQLRNQSICPYTPFDELMSSLLSHEARLKKSSTKVEEKAFQAKGEFSFKGKSENFGDRGQGRGGFCGRGRGQFGDCQNKRFIQCRYCKRNGHKDFDGWAKQKDEKLQDYENIYDENKQFEVQSPTQDTNNELWFVNSGCSNHMFWHGDDV